MMTISESQWSSNKRSSIHKLNDKIIHHDDFNDVQQSSSNSSSLITKRGFKPSDMFDPQKKEFLTNLSYKLFPNDRVPSPRVSPICMGKENEDYENKHLLIGDKEVDLNKIFTPAPDAEENMIKKNRKFEKTFASSAFYVPGIHPTVKEQMDLARAISRSLSDSSNQMSKGQSMYVNRKKRSVKWVHEGKGRNTSNTCVTPTPSVNHDTPYRPPSSLRQQTNKFGTYPKPALKNSSLPKIEPFPEVAKKTVHIPIQTYSPVTPTKLNDVYAPPKSPRIPLLNGKSFNTAPRGWGEIKDYYRPVTLDDAGNTYNTYSDY